MITLRLAATISFLVITLLGCDTPNNSQKDPGIFKLIDANESGVTFCNQLKEDIYTHENVLTFDYFYNGSGVATGDFDGDGLCDIFFCGNQVSNKLYRNDGHFKFTDISRKSGIEAKTRWSNGATIVDINNDGYLDIYVSCGGPSINASDRENLLFINNGDGTFKERAKELGVNDSNWSTQSSFSDFDKDGDLDLVVMNYTTYWRVPIPEVVGIMKDTSEMLKATNHLYRNDGSNGFTNITIEAGMLNFGYGLGLSTVDINNDGWTDIYIANDYSVPDRMYINQKNGTFKDEIKERTNQLTYYAMGCDIADMDKDGEPEVVVVDMAISDHKRSKKLMASMNTDLFYFLKEDLNYPDQYMYNSLQQNLGGGSFKNIALQKGIAQSEWSWAPLIFDCDNDGNNDLFISNGIPKYSRDNDFRLAMKAARDSNGGSVPHSLKQKLYDQMPSVPLANKLYLNQGKFQLNAKDAFNEQSFSYGAAYADLDNDGDLDLIINNLNDTSFVYQNQTISSNQTVQIDLISGNLYSEALNAKVTLKSEEGQHLKELAPVRGYCSSVDPILHFALTAEDKPLEVLIAWPDGTKESFSCKNKSLLKPVKGNGTMVKPNEAANPKELLSSIAPEGLGIKYKHFERPYIEYDFEILLPHTQGKLGPFMAAADINSDGFDDLYIGGGSYQSGALYIGTNNGKFRLCKTQPWTEDYLCEDMESLFFDADGDGDLDLITVSGGGSDMLSLPKQVMQDRLYLNQGNEIFTKSNLLPTAIVSGKSVVSLDIENDGDQDLVIAGRTTPGAYPVAPQSQILINEDGKFTDRSSQISTDFKTAGMITDMSVADVDGNGFQDIIVVGEWMSPTIYFNSGSSLKPQILDTSQFGMWQSVLVADLNKDGHLDIVAGNIGDNNKYQPSVNHPLYLYANDFDNNGRLDIVLAKDYQNQVVPVRGRECSSQQMPFIKDKFKSFDAFANASIIDIYGQDKIKNSIDLKAQTFSSGIFWGNKTGFNFQKLPEQIQRAPLMDILPIDIDKDDVLELVTGGNIYNTEPETPKYDAGRLNILNFHHKNPAVQTQISVTQTKLGNSDIKNLKFIKSNAGDFIFATSNNDSLRTYTFSNDNE